MKPWEWKSSREALENKKKEIDKDKTLKTKTPKIC